MADPGKRSHESAYLLHPFLWNFPYDHRVSPIPGFLMSQDRPEPSDHSAPDELANPPEEFIFLPPRFLPDRRERRKAEGQVSLNLGQKTPIPGR